MNADAEPKTLTLSVLVPVYNEQYTVRQVVEELQRVAWPEGVGLEIVVVDDGSTDGTREILKELEAGIPGLNLVFHEQNGGKGSAIRTAIAEARGDVMVIQDADLEYDPHELPRLLKPILEGRADAVYGSRFAPSTTKRVLFFWHSVGNKFLTLLSNFFTNLDLTDMETCYKMVRGPMLKSIPLRSNGFGLEPELTAKLAKRGCRIYEAPISYFGRTYQEGKKITWRDGFVAIGTILYFWAVDDLYHEKSGHGILQSLSRAHRFNRWMADAIKPWAGEHVLEIGAGIGNLSLQMLPRRSYTPSDIDDLHLDYLRSRFDRNPRVSVRKVDVTESSDFDAIEGRYDTVVCLNVIEHVEDDLAALRNIRRALQPGGHACLLVPHNPKLFGTLDTVLGHYRRYTPGQFQERLEEAGFEVKKIFTFNRVTVPGWYINGRILKREHFGRLQLKLFDSTVWLWRKVDRFLPWGGVSVIAYAERLA